MKTINKRRIKNNKKNNKKKNKKTNKKTSKNNKIFSEKELKKINKIIKQLEDDINYIISGNKKQVEKKKNKLKIDYNILRTGKKSQKGGGNKEFFMIGGAVFLTYLGLDAFYDPEHAETLSFLNNIPGFGSDPLIGTDMAITMFPMLVRVASKMYFREFGNMLFAHMGCNRYVKQTSGTQESIDKKNKSMYEMEAQIKGMQMYVSMGTMVGMLAMSSG